MLGTRIDCTLVITPPARVGHGGVINSPRSIFLGFFLFLFGVENWAAAHGWYRCAMPFEPMSSRPLNSISSRICLQNTQFNMDTTTSKQQEVCTFKNSHPKCFITTNSIARLSPGAVNCGEVFRACFRHFQLCFHLNFYTSIKLIFYTKHTF